MKQIAEVEKHIRIKAWTVEDAQYCPSYEFNGITEPAPVVQIDKLKFEAFPRAILEMGLQSSAQGGWRIYIGKCIEGSMAYPFRKSDVSEDWK